MHQKTPCNHTKDTLKMYAEIENCIYSFEPAIDTGTGGIRLLIRLIRYQGYLQSLI